jgi:hypothetical protein
VFHARALYHTKTLITNKCTKRVLSSIVTHSYMFRPCWSSSGRTFCYRYTKVALYTSSWVRMCCWLCTALFLEAWTLCGPGLQCLGVFIMHLSWNTLGPLLPLCEVEIFLWGCLCTSREALEQISYTWKLLCLGYRGFYFSRQWPTSGETYPAVPACRPGPQRVHAS